MDIRSIFGCFFVLNLITRYTTRYLKKSYKEIMIPIWLQKILLINGTRLVPIEVFVLQTTAYIIAVIGIIAYAIPYPDGISELIKGISHLIGLLGMLSSLAFVRISSRYALGMKKEAKTESIIWSILIGNIIILLVFQF